MFRCGGCFVVLAFFPRISGEKKNLSVLFDGKVLSLAVLGVHRVQNSKKLLVFLVTQPRKSICLTPGMVPCSTKTHLECSSSEVPGQVGSCPVLKLKFRGPFLLLDTLWELD